LKLKYDAIEYFVFESASSIVYWDEEKQQFVKIATSELGGEVGVRNLFRGFKIGGIDSVL